MRYQATETLYTSPSGMIAFVPKCLVGWLVQQSTTAQDDYLRWCRFGGDEEEDTAV